MAGAWRNREKGGRMAQKQSTAQQALCWENAISVGLCIINLGFLPSQPYTQSWGTQLLWEAVLFQPGEGDTQHPPRGLCRGQVYQGSQQERVSAWVKMDMVFNHSMLNLLLQNTWLQLLNERVVRSLFDQCGALPAGSCNWYPGIRHSVPFSVSALCASCGTVTLLIHLWHGLVRLQYLANEGFSSLR